MCRVVRGAVGAGCQIAAVGGQQDAPPLGEIHDPGGDEQNAQDRPCDPVGGAEEIVLHPGECFKGFFVVLHLNRIANHKNCPRIL